jgi:hypothetical protein
MSPAGWDEVSEGPALCIKRPDAVGLELLNNLCQQRQANGEERGNAAGEEQGRHHNDEDHQGPAAGLKRSLLIHISTVWAQP